MIKSGLKMYEKVEKFVVDSFTKVGKIHQIVHFKNTVEWIKKLKPDADEALCIAAVAHDIERAFRKEDMMGKKKKYGFSGKEFLKPHQERCAKIIGDFLEKESADKKLIKKVKMLVIRHEEGGNKDRDLLKDADSLSFFEITIPYFLTDKKIDEIGGKQGIKEKLDWMYNRISSEKAKEIAKPMYEDSIEKLNSK